MLAVTAGAATAAVPAAVAGGSEFAGERLRRAAFGPEIPPSGEAKLPPISGQKSSLRTVNYYYIPNP